MVGLKTKAKSHSIFFPVVSLSFSSHSQFSAARLIHQHAMKLFGIIIGIGTYTHTYIHIFTGASDNRWLKSVQRPDIFQNVSISLRFRASFAIHCCCSFWIFVNLHVKFCCGMRFFQKSCVRCRSLNELTERIYFVVGNHFSLSLVCFFSLICVLFMCETFPFNIHSEPITLHCHLCCCCCCCCCYHFTILFVFSLSFSLLSHICLFAPFSSSSITLSHTYTTSRHSFHAHLEFYSLLDFKWNFVDDGMTWMLLTDDNNSRAYYYFYKEIHIILLPLLNDMLSL